MEIERQFLVDALPLLPNEYDTIRQGYVALLPEIRIRQVGDSRFTLTVKRGAGLVREAGANIASRSCARTRPSLAVGMGVRNLTAGV